MSSDVGNEDDVARFDPERSAFAHAGAPAGNQPSSQPKAPRRDRPRKGPLHAFQENRTASISAERLLRGLHGTNVTLAYQNVDLVYQWIANPPSGFENIAGQRDGDILPADTASQLSTAKRHCIDAGEGSHLSIDLGDGPSRWFDVWLEPDAGQDGHVEGVIVVATEVTGRIEREERLRVLLREVSHRSRNLLAIVQSIAAQTARASSAPMRFLDRFNERLQSLAHTLDLVTVREWEGATLHQLVSRQAGPFVSSTGMIEIAGPDPVLTPNAALHLGLGVQELASNASNHGAWSRADGMVYAKTRMRDEDDTLVFEWTEAGDPGAATADVPGSFGSRTLMTIVPAALNGEASMRREGPAFVYRLTIPSGNFDA